MAKKAALILEFDVLGKPWTLRCLDKKRYCRSKTRANSVAITYRHKRRIDLSPAGLDHETLVHELVHAYLYEMCLYSTNDMSLDDLEEVFCELLSKRGREVLDLADALVARIKECDTIE